MSENDAHESAVNGRSPISPEILDPHRDGPTAYVGVVAVWGPLTADALREVLQLAAEVADADSGHDLLSALDVLNKDRLIPANRPPLYEAELRQVARALLAVIPAMELGGAFHREVAMVETWLMVYARVRPGSGSPGRTLAELFKLAATLTEQSQPPRLPTEGGDCHA